MIDQLPSLEICHKTASHPRESYPPLQPLYRLVVSTQMSLFTKLTIQGAFFAHKKDKKFFLGFNYRFHCGRVFFCEQFVD